MRAALTLCAVLLVAGCVESPAPVSPPPQASEDPLPLDADGCPTRPQALKDMRGDAPGRLVDPGGVTAVTLCERAGAKRTDYPPDFGKPRKLTTKLSEMVTALNALPDRAAAQAQTGEPMPASYQECAAVDFFANFAMSVKYPDRTVVVLLDRNCRLAFAGGRTRYGLPSPIDTFLGFYREQLAASAGPVPDRPCPGAIDPARLDGRTSANEPFDGIGRNRGDNGPYLPSPLSAITICRYDKARLVAHKTMRASLGAAQEWLNSSIGSKQTSECGNPNNDGWQPTALDTLWVADATGAVSEIRVWRAPCAALRAIYFDGYVAPPGLLAQLDGWLKP